MRPNEIYSSMLILFVLFNILIGVQVYRNSNTRAKNIFLLFLGCVSIYTFAYSQELLTSQLERAMFWIKIEYIGLAFLPYCWLMFFLELSGNLEGLIDKIKKIMIIFSTVILLSVWTTEYHHLYYKGVAMIDQGGFFVLGIDRGPIYFILSGYNLFIILITTIMCVYMLIKYTGIIRKQYILLTLAMFFAWISQYLNTFKIFPYGFDVVPFFICLLDIVIGVAIMRYKMVTVTPIAYDVVFEHMNDAVIIVDEQDNISSFNSKMKKLYNNLNGKDIGRNYNEVFKQYPELKILTQNVSVDNNDFDISIKNGTMLCNVKISEVIEKDKRVGYLVIVKDKTKESIYLKKLEYLANYDSLTNLYNRGHFFEKANQSMLNNEIAAIIFDIDNFKILNDNYGHHAGDMALKTIAEVMKDVIDHTGYCGRIGGEEFAIVLEKSDILDANKIANELRNKIEEQVTCVDNNKLRVTASFGVAQSLSNDNSYEDLLRRADQAMYFAKVSGKNCVKSYHEISSNA